MIAKFRILYYYLSEFLLAISVLGLFLLVVIKITILNPNYMFQNFERNDYYTKLSDSIYSTMSNYIIQSGLEEEVLENIYTKDMVKDDLRAMIRNFYQGKELVIDTSEVKEKLERNIDTFLEKNNLSVDDEAELDQFEEQMISIYQEKINFSNGLNSIQSIFVKILKYCNIGLFVLGLLTVILALSNKIITKKVVLAVPFIATFLLVLLGNYLFFQRIDVRHILFWNENVSSILQDLIFGISQITIIGSSILLVIGIILIILKKDSVSKKKTVPR